jgi:high affinity Mn2+ porin
MGRPVFKYPLKLFPLRRLAFSIIFAATAWGTHAQQTDSLKDDRLSIHGQTTVINQFKPSFSAPYSGPNSLSTKQESKTSITATLYVGARLWKGASLFVNPEIAGGSGLSGALGIAAATNGETFRIGDPAPQIYLARLFFHQVIALSDETTYQGSEFNQLGEKLPNKYFAFTAGKISVSDFFDDNKYSHDPRTQFMSWALMGNGAWDYPANTRGYTPSMVLEYVSPVSELRFGLSLLPTTANGSTMNWKVGKSAGYTLEYTHKHKINNQDGAFRVLAFYNTTDMGNYNQSIALNPTAPDITATRAYGHSKYGFAINAEQSISRDFGGFFRASWNDGHNETWVFTEIDRSISIGAVLNGRSWKRANDNIGLAFVTSGLSTPHQQYLKDGGDGFILGDGNLNYGLEHLAEFYYSAELIKDRMFLSGAYQMVLNPGYNKDRSGPVNVFSVRLHMRM